MKRRCETRSGKVSDSEYGGPSNVNSALLLLYTKDGMASFIHSAHINVGSVPELWCSFWNFFLFPSVYTWFGETSPILSNVTI